MSLLELCLLAVGLSMDAFAVSVCKGLAVKKVDWKALLLVGLWFGGFQALMPAIGYFLGSFCKEFVTSVSHWIAFALLAFIGGNMLLEAVKKEEDDGQSASLGAGTMFLLAIATSIDALAVGITFAFLDVVLPVALTFIGVTTFLFSDAGLLIGRAFGKRYKQRAEIAGGIILILLGVKILLEGLGIL